VGRAGELVATGRALRALQATEKALMAGQLSFDSAHVICRTATQIPDPSTAAVAEERLLAFGRFPEPEPEEPDAGPDADHPDPDGTDRSQRHATVHAPQRLADPRQPPAQPDQTPRP
jgi:hypothetical protein